MQERSHEATKALEKAAPDHSNSRSCETKAGPNVKAVRENTETAVWVLKKHEHDSCATAGVKHVPWTLEIAAQKHWKTLQQIIPKKNCQKMHPERCKKLSPKHTKICKTYVRITAMRV